MTFRHHITLGLLCALTVAAGPLPAQNQPAAGQRETTGEKLDDAVRSIRRGAREAGQTIQQQFERTRTSVHNMGVSGRVYSRLHWDKDLQGSNVHLDVAQNGVATLTGTVPDARAKAKAVALTQDTVGVTRVVDQTAIAPANTDASDTTAKPAGADAAKP